MNHLPLCEDSKITGSHILAIGQYLQGGAGLDGCNALHWRDVLLCYGASSGCLQDSVTALFCHLG